MLENEILIKKLNDSLDILKNDFNESLKRIKVLEKIIDIYKEQSGIQPFDALVRKTEKGLTHFSKIGFGPSRLGGNGVFALSEIVEGEVIEVAPILICFQNSLQNSPLVDYYFAVEDEGDLLCAIPFGYGMLYNHNDDASAHWIINIERREILFIANKNIAENEEITINYSEEYWKSNARLNQKIV